MLPLSLAEAGITNIVKKIGGRGETRRQLESLGFVLGSEVTVINHIERNVIVKIKESRVALSEELAGRIMV